MRFSFALAVATVMTMAALDTTAQVIPERILVGASNTILVYENSAAFTKLAELKVSDTPVSIVATPDRLKVAAVSPTTIELLDMSTAIPTITLSLALPADLRGRGAAYVNGRLLVLVEGLQSKMYIVSIDAVGTIKSELTLRSICVDLAGEGDRALTPFPNLSETDIHDFSTGSTASLVTTIPNRVAAVWSTGFALASSKEVRTFVGGTSYARSFASGQIKDLTATGTRIYVIGSASQQVNGIDLPNTLRSPVTLSGHPVASAAATAGDLLFVATMKPSGGAIEVVDISGPTDTWKQSIGFTPTPVSITVIRAP